MTKPDLYAARRRRLMEKMGPDAVAVFVAPPQRQRSHDTEYPYRPSSDIIYLCGFEEPEAVLVLAPGHEDGDFAMFVRNRDPEKETWDGRRAGPEGAKAHFGADAAYVIDDLDEELPRFLQGRETLWYTLGNDATFDGKITQWLNKLRFRRGAAPAAPRQIADARDIVHEMRVHKEPAELDVMRTAARIASDAHIAAMKAVRPGMHEYEIQALLEYSFRRRGAFAPAYTTIVGSGVNATILHYTENRDPLGASDILLIDAGCEYQYYAADITRSYPVSGKFTPAQRDVYQAILEAQKAAIDDVQPGVAYNELQDRTARRLSQALIDLGILTGSVDENLENETYKQFYPHRVGHWLGSDVHDVGSYHDAEGNWRPLAPGMVVTVEPGLYFPETAEIPDAFKGIGIRIEDDILVTAQGNENLTASCPKEVADLEAIIGTAAADQGALS